MKHPAQVAAAKDDSARAVIQFEGLPENRERQAMRAATHLVIAPDDDGCFLIRFADDAFAGDTWHESFAEAKSQAASEFCLALDKWVAVPVGRDPAEWSGQAIRSILNE